MNSRDHFDQLKSAEKEALFNGYLTGAAFFVGALGYFKYRSLMGRPVSFYYAGVVTCLSALVSSQLMTHFLYIQSSDRIQFQRRMEAAQKTEERNRAYR